MSITVYIKPDKNTQVHSPDVFLGQVAQVWCREKNIESRCKAMKILSIDKRQEERYVISVMKLVEQIQQMDPHTEIVNLGEADFIIDYQPQPRQIGYKDWIKTALVCVIVFFGGAFAIMTFNNDGAVSQIFQDVDRLWSGTAEGSTAGTSSQKKSVGVVILEVSYSVGLILGVTLFFNHFGKHKVTLDPTPIEVQMRLYEDQVDTTVIQNAARNESGVDIQ